MSFNWYSISKKIHTKYNTLRFPLKSYLLIYWLRNRSVSSASSQNSTVYKHYLHDKFLKHFWNFWWLFNILSLCHDFVFGQVKARNTINYFLCILSKIFSTINHTFLWFYELKNRIFDGSPYSAHRVFPVMMLVIVPLNSLFWVKVGHQCKNKSGPKMWCATIPPYTKHGIIVELWGKLLLYSCNGSIIKLMHENAAVREWLVASDVTVNFSCKTIPSIPHV